MQYKYLILTVICIIELCNAKNFQQYIIYSNLLNLAITKCLIKDTLMVERLIKIKYCYFLAKNESI